MSLYGGQHYPQNNINKLPALKQKTKQNKTHTVNDPSAVVQKQGCVSASTFQWAKQAVEQSVLADIIMLHPEQKAMYLLNLAQGHFFFFFENGILGGSQACATTPF